MHSDRSDCLTPIKKFVLRHKGIAQESQTMVSKLVGVRTAWCVGVGTLDDPEDATLQAVFKVRGCISIAMVDDKS